MRRTMSAALAAILFCLALPVPASAVSFVPFTPPTVSSDAKPSLTAPEDVPPLLPGSPAVSGAPDPTYDLTAALAAAAPTDTTPVAPIESHATDARSAGVLTTGVFDTRVGDGKNGIVFTYFDDGDIAVVLDPGSTGHAGIFERASYRYGLNSWALISANVTPVEGVQLEQCVKYRLYDTAYALWVPKAGLKAAKARAWAARQIGKPYGLIRSKTDTRSFYCSKLVWAAYYYTTGLDLDGTGGYWVWPVDLVLSRNTRIFGVWT